MNRMCPSSRCLATLLILSISLPPTLGVAGPKEALGYYEQATAAYQKGELKKALGLLERAYAEDPNLIYQYNRILVLRDLKRYDEALRLLDVYYNPLLNDKEKRFTDIEQVRDQIRKAKSEQVAADKKKAEQEAREKARAEAERKKREEEARKKAQNDLEKNGDRASAGPNWLAWGLIGGGGLLLGGAGLFGSTVLISDSITRLDCAQSGSDPSCYDDPAFGDFGSSGDGYDDTAYQDDLSTYKTHRAVTIGLLAAGTLAVAGGVVVLLMGDGETEAAKEGSANLRLVPYAGPRAAGAVVHLEF